MFEHLSPTIDTKTRKKSSRWSRFLPALFFSVFLFFVSSGIGQGPSSRASIGEFDFSPKIFIDQNSKQVVYLSDNISVFDFVLDSNKDGAYLNKLRINISGTYDLDFVDSLKLYNDGTQLGTIKELDDHGNISFSLKNYPLAKGKNYFSIRIIDARRLSKDNIVKFSIYQRPDVSISYQDNIFMPQAEFPLIGGDVAFVEKGYLTAFMETDRYQKKVLAAYIPQKINNFYLLSYGEVADLRSLIFSFEGPEPTGSFALIQNSRLLATADAQDGKIKFLLKDPIIVKEKESFELHATSLPEGNFNFYLEEVEALGYNSGVNIFLNDSLSFGAFDVYAYYLEFVSGDLDTRLSDGWNKLYQLDLRPVGLPELEIYKLSWDVDYQGLEIEDLELWLDGKPYIADLVISGNKIIFKSSWENPIVINNRGSKLELLGKISISGQKAMIGTYLLYDKEPIVGDGLSGNIVIYDGKNFVNSYKMPYLPLEPNVLSK